MVQIKSVGVIGAGQMGSGIAHVCALAGYDVLLHDVSEDKIAAGLSLIERNLSRQVARGIVDRAGTDPALVKGCELVLLATPGALLAPSAAAIAPPSAAWPGRTATNWP